MKKYYFNNVRLFCSHQIRVSQETYAPAFTSLWECLMFINTIGFSGVIYVKEKGDETPLEQDDLNMQLEDILKEYASNCKLRVIGEQNCIKVSEYGSSDVKIITLI